MTAGMVVLLQRKRPDLLVRMGVLKAGTGDRTPPGLKGPGTREKVALRTLSIAVLLASSLLTPHPSPAAEKWPGVDDAVVGKFARERGRGEKAPLIDLEGDAQLFAFLAAGAAGGFAAGYWWRMLVSEKKKGPDTKS